MKMKKLAVSVAAIAIVPVQAMAADPILQPTPVGFETVRFMQGVPTLDLRKEHGAVQVTPLPMDHGGYAFTVAVINQGTIPANIDVANFDVESAGQHYTVLSRSDLEHKAKKRAMWASIALAAAGGLSAAAAASARDTYHATTFTPHGTYQTFISTPSASGQVLAAATAAATGAGLVAIQSQLDRTREALGATTVQLTTIDPGDSYAGRIVLTKIKAKSLPQRINIVVNWNGETYPFAFQMAAKGSPQPVFPVPAPLPIAPSPAAPASGAAPAAPAVIHASLTK